MTLGLERTLLILSQLMAKSPNLRGCAELKKRNPVLLLFSSDHSMFFLPIYLNNNVIKLHKIVKVKEQSYSHIDKIGANFDTNLDRERLAMSCANKS